MRFSIIDGFRGFFLLFMGVVHINMVTDVNLGKLNHHYFGWVEDAQGFVFISGLVVGLVYGGILLRKGPQTLRRAMWKRMQTIYTHHAGLILLMLVASFVFSQIGILPQILGQYVQAPVAFTLASLGLVSGSAHMGILPMYLWFMSITPLVLLALHQAQTPVLICLAAAAWLFAQLGLVELITLWAEQTLARTGSHVSFGIYFNVFAWQILFFSGLYCGFRHAEGKLDLSFLKAPVYRQVFVVGLVIFLSLGLYDRIVFDNWISTGFTQQIKDVTDRGNLSVIYIAAFYLDLFLVTWLLVAGAHCGQKWIELLSRAVRWFFTRRFLVFLGQHSLHVFSFHILLVYVIDILLEGEHVGELQGSLILLAGVLSLYLPALWHAKVQTKAKASKAQVPPLAKTK